MRGVRPPPRPVGLMVLWFVGPAIVAVWSVFRSPSADYRVVAVGALLPLLELPFGEPRLLHSLRGAALGMGVGMVGARGQRLPPRRLLGRPVGGLLPLVAH